MVAGSVPVLVPVAAAPPVIITPQTLVSMIISAASISLLCPLSPVVAVARRTVVVLVIVARRRPPVLVTVSVVVDTGDGGLGGLVAAMSSIVETEVGPAWTAIIDSRCGLVGRPGDTKIHANPVSIQFHSIHSPTCLLRFCD